MTEFSEAMRAFRRWCQKHNIKPEGMRIEFHCPTQHDVLRAQEALRSDFDMLTMETASPGAEPQSCYGIPFQFTRLAL